jgi:hypothetical protein
MGSYSFVESRMTIIIMMNVNKGLSGEGGISKRGSRKGEDTEG